MPFLYAEITRKHSAQDAGEPRWTDSAAQKAVLALARRAFDAYTLRRETIDPPHPLPVLFREPAAVFVSAMRPNGSPRCCVGSLDPTQPDAAEEIIAGTDYRYVQLEDPIPAGCEVSPGGGEDGSYPLDSSEGATGYTRQEVRDDRVVFFFDSLPKGRTRLTYRLHAETPGAYQVLPSLAALTYFPEIRGSSGLVRAKIGERP